MTNFILIDTEKYYQESYTDRILNESSIIADDALRISGRITIVYYPIRRYSGLEPQILGRFNERRYDVNTSAKLDRIWNRVHFKCKDAYIEWQWSPTRLKEIKKMSEPEIKRRRTIRILGRIKKIIEDIRQNNPMFNEQEIKKRIPFIDITNLIIQ